MTDVEDLEFGDGWWDSADKVGYMQKKERESSKGRLVTDGGKETGLGSSRSSRIRPLTWLGCVPVPQLTTFHLLQQLVVGYHEEILVGFPNCFLI
jgi:hypothetical protein